MSSGYQVIFWGIFFSSFHLNLGIIQILPVFVAWIIVSNGINKLIAEQESVCFKKAYTYAGFAILLSLSAGVISLINQGIATSILFTLAYPIIFGILELLSEANILAGSAEYLEDNGEAKLARELRKATRNYILIFFLFLLLQCISLSLYVTWITYVAIFGLVLRLYFMGQMSSLKRYYENEESKHHGNAACGTDYNQSSDIITITDSNNKEYRYEVSKIIEINKDESNQTDL